MDCYYSGRGVFNTEFRYEWSPYDIELANEGLEAKVIEYLDYGREKFLKIDVYGEEFIVATNEAYEGNIKIKPNVEKTSVLEIKRSIRII